MGTVSIARALKRRFLRLSSHCFFFFIRLLKTNFEVRTLLYCTSEIETSDRKQSKCPHRRLLRSFQQRKISIRLGQHRKTWSPTTLLWRINATDKNSVSSIVYQRPCNKTWAISLPWSISWTLLWRSIIKSCLRPIPGNVSYVNSLPRPLLVTFFPNSMWKKIRVWLVIRHPFASRMHIVIISFMRKWKNGTLNMNWFNGNTHTPLSWNEIFKMFGTARWRWSWRASVVSIWKAKTRILVSIVARCSRLNWSDVADAKTFRIVPEIVRLLIGPSIRLIVLRMRASSLSVSFQKLRNSITISGLLQMQMGLQSMMCSWLLLCKVVWIYYSTRRIVYPLIVLMNCSWLLLRKHI